jgi:sulfite exporter TauE/SafE
MELALLLSALALALAGVPHCTAMCGAPCAAVTGGRRGEGGAMRRLAFHGMRVVGYAAAGAVAASSVGALAAASQWSPALRPLWTALHAAAFSLGLWMLWQGRQSAWLESIGRGGARATPTPGRWQRVRGPLSAGTAGVMWVAWPCGLLQSALLLAALANDAAGGALVMAGFALVSATGLWLGPGVWAWLGGPAVATRAATWGARLAGGALALASGWALTHGLWIRLWDWCFG